MVQKKNILYYEPSSGFGGSSSNLIHILNKTNKEFYNPIVLVHHDGAQFDKMRALGYSVIKIEVPKRNSDSDSLMDFFKTVLPLSLKLIDFIIKNQIDLVHVNTNVMLGIPIIIASKLTGKKVVSHIRETRSFTKKESFFSKFVNHFIVINQDAFKLYQKLIPKKKISLIYDGVDLNVFKEANSNQLANEFGDYRFIGLIGRIVEGKGHKEFIEAANLVFENNSSVRFVIVGDVCDQNRDLLDELKRNVIEKQLNNIVCFTGWRNDVLDIISSLDILVLPSTTFPEGLPNSILEAMALKKPVIATNIPGPKEAVADGKNGYIINPPGNFKMLAQKIIELLENETLAQTMGEFGYQRIIKEFNTEIVANKIQEIYHKLGC